LLTINNLHTWHGWNHALKGVTFEVPEGSVVAIIGANGAGKSTLLGTIAGVYPCSVGEVILNGKPVHNMAAERVVRQGICLVPERRQIFDTLTVEENLILGAYHRWGKSGKKVILEEIDEIMRLFPVLNSRRNDPAGQLSGGMQQMLAIGRGLMAKPKILLLDEPSLGLAPRVVKEIFQTLDTLKGMGTTILLVEQNAKAAMQVADWVCVLDQGKIVLEGKPASLKRDFRIQQVYLGKGYDSLAQVNSL